MTDVHLVIGAAPPISRGVRPRSWAKIGDDPWREAASIDIQMSREAIDVTMGQPYPDPNASWVDRDGHIHTVRPQTYQFREVYSWWCEDCHEQHVDEEALCPLCGDTVDIPMLPPDTFRRFVPGLSSVTVDVDFGPDVPAVRLHATGELRRYEQDYGLRGTHYVVAAFAV